MTGISIDGVRHEPVKPVAEHTISIERLRTIIQDSHLNFLIGAGTPSALFGQLGDIENALTRIEDVDATDDDKLLIRASLLGYYFKKAIYPNRKLLPTKPKKNAERVLASYEAFLRTVHRILVKRHSSLLHKQVNIFTTNMDMAFEVAMEALRLDSSDGFAGRIRPRFDLGEFKTLRYRLGSRYEHRSEMPVFNLYKLHGSVGWRPKDASILFDGRLELVSEVHAAFDAAKASLLGVVEGESGQIDLEAMARAINPELPQEDEGSKSVDEGEASGASERDLESVEEFLEAYGQLGIVNPDKEKFATTVLNETYYELIRRFANELERENSVLFVHGFSFRDEHLRDLVIRAARTNPTLQVIVFCYSNASLADIQLLLPEKDIKNGNVLYVAPALIQGDEPTDNQPEEAAPLPDDQGDRGAHLHGGDDVADSAPSTADPIEEMLDLDVLTSEFLEPIVPGGVPQPDQRIELSIRTNRGGDDAR